MTSSAKKSPTSKRSKKTKNKVLKWVRRIHMYTGLVLLPWVILFGFSGMLFNHPDLSSSVKVVASHSAAELNALEKFDQPDPDRLADEVLAKINSGGGSAFKRDSGNDAVIEGVFKFQASGESGRASVSLSPGYGTAELRETTADKAAAKPEFSKTLEGALAGYDAENAEAVAKQVFKNAGIEIEGDIETVERGAASVRFRIVSEDGKTRWNVSHNLVTGALAVRETKAPLGVDLYGLLTQLHKTHHYPDRFSVRWMWTAFGDATGITMVFWGISGLIMWWQIKPTRVLGVAGLSFAAVLAFVLFTGTLSYNNWVPRQSKGGGSRSPQQSSKAGADAMRGNDRPGNGVPKGERSKGAEGGKN